MGGGGGEERRDDDVIGVTTTRLKLSRSHQDKTNWGRTLQLNSSSSTLWRLRNFGMTLNNIF